jgi:hypothetical protein
MVKAVPLDFILFYLFFHLQFEYAACSFYIDLKLKLTIFLLKINLKGERNQLMIWGFTEFRTNKKMKI